MRGSEAYQQHKQIFEEAIREYELTCVDFYKEEDRRKKQHREAIKNRVHFDVQADISEEDEKQPQKEHKYNPRIER